VSNGKTDYKQNEISKAITNFYKNLYQEQVNVTPPDDNKIFKDLPQVPEEIKSNLSKPITLNELELTLKTCNESAPGPDGISYNTLKHTWKIMGPLILNGWEHSCKTGKTSPTQRKAVITLLEKKGKDKSIIENLRPISLSNCDIKLCTKALAIRTNTVLPHILSKTQTGYIPGRQVNDNSRLIEEIIRKLNDENEKAYLITLDAQKAFDSVNHKYLFHILEKFGFPSEYIGYVKLIYSNISASVMVNGHMGEEFNIDQSVKQGDALSCSLFIIAIEPLLRQLDNNKNIEGIKVTYNNIESEIKNASYADDITAICVNLNGIQEIIDEYLNFSKYSGIKLNLNKTEILVIGKKEDRRENFILKKWKFHSKYH